ncbi:tyrosine-type recombinase/integrase [Actinoplanes sp. NPDC026670]|uniref:tyrosine-type recombinase/integrase n=1 Tax=Actinoplanes sp. NPDC026670 TaxID=3154700 RepID=UPI00340BC2B2
MGRKPNGASSIYKGADGAWHGRVTVGTKPDGTPDRRHVSGKTEAVVTRKVRDLERSRDDGTVRKVGQRWTVKSWLTHWVENIAAPSVRETTMVGYRAAVYKHLIPGVGAHRLEKLEPEHLEHLYTKMIRSGSAPGTAHQTHRTVKTALNVAVRRGHLGRNVAQLAKPPRLDEQEIEPFTVEEAQRLLDVAAGKRNGVRFALALALGLRKGETLGLKWHRVDLDKGLLRTPRQIQRYKWQHGCDNPNKCGERLHKMKPCPPVCHRHQRACPPPCPADCSQHASRCPQKHGGGLKEVDVKSRAGRRAVGIPAPIVAALREHRKVQDQERERARQMWEESGWVFAQQNGRPIDPRADHDAWKNLLQEAGVRDARLHDARHTAATMLLVLGVPTRAVMEVMGWSQMAMTTRYQHLAPELAKGIADQVAGLLWKTN